MGASASIRDRLDELVAFHGHLCPGLTLGMRVAEVVLREIGSRASDEELIAVLEATNCAADAIQYLTGCTLGKGNLIVRDYGKNAFTFARRSDGKALRIVVRPPSKAGDRAGSSASAASGEQTREARALAVLDAAEEDLFVTEWLAEFPLPEPAQVYPSVRCDVCGEMAMCTRVHSFGDRHICEGCYREMYGAPLTLRPIGVIHNHLVPHQAPPRTQEPRSTIEVYPAYANALLRIEACTHLQVLFAFDKAPREGVSLQQHPQGNTSKPLRGVFALRSPHRPNPVGLTTVELLGVEGSQLIVSGLDAWDGTPVLDIKPHVPHLDERADAEAGCP